MLTLIKFAEKALQTGAFSANFVNSAQQSERIVLLRADKPFCSKAVGRSGRCASLKMTACKSSSDYVWRNCSKFAPAKRWFVPIKR